MMLSRVLGVVGLTIGAIAVALVILAAIAIAVIAAFPNVILFFAHS